MRSRMLDNNTLVDGTLVVDIDGTLCEIKRKDQQYIDVEPKLDVINKLHEYRSKGYKILLYTSRNMNTHEGNLGLINRYTAPIMFEWLEKWKVPYDEILFGKPWPRHNGFYIDDRAVRPDEFVKYSEDEIHALLGQSK
jgi:capsule biosynthesis phosphatase